jgi:metallophosphoesterase (TIGR00282 family)
MRILFIGDVVGRPGVNFVRAAVPLLRESERLDLVIANAENAAGGSGLTPTLYRQLRAAGVDAVTLGDHIYRRSEVIPLLQNEPRVCKPANFPPEAPGRDLIIVPTADGTPVAVMSLMGRTFMRPVDCPFHAADRVLKALPEGVRCVVVDAHAEATADKYLLVHHLRGRVSAVLGTHTHVPTADEQILPGGTAFITDVGMTGPYDSILGRRIDRVMSTTITFVPSPFDVATGDPRICGVLVEIDPATGRATSIARVVIRDSGHAAAATDGAPEIPDGAETPMLPETPLASD